MPADNRSPFRLLTDHDFTMAALRRVTEPNQPTLYEQVETNRSRSDSDEPAERHRGVRVVSMDEYRQQREVAERARSMAAHPSGDRAS